MSIPLYPPTPPIIEGFSLDDMLRDDLIKSNLNDIVTAIYFLANSNLTSTGKMMNWNAINARVKILQDRAIELRRESLAPTITIETDIPIADIDYTNLLS